jgi:hypothetical protein
MMYRVFQKWDKHDKLFKGGMGKILENLPMIIAEIIKL